MPKVPASLSYKSLLRMRIPCAGEPVFKARSRLATVLRRLGFSADSVDGILLAFSEAVTNAIVYGSAPVRKCVRVHAGLENGCLVLEVMDHGKGFHPDKVKLPPPECMREGGRGLFLMRAFMDEVEWIPTDHGTTVRMVKCFTTTTLADAYSAVPPSSLSPSSAVAAPSAPGAPGGSVSLPTGF